MIRAAGALRHLVLLVPVSAAHASTFVAPSVATHDAAIARAQQSYDRFVLARTQGASRATIDALWTELELAAASAGSTASRVLQQCSPQPRVTRIAPPARLTAPPCGTGTLTTTTLTSPIVAPIPDAISTAQSGWGTIEDFQFAFGLDAYIWDVEVTTNIVHPRCNDLRVFLLGPTGRQITLTTDNNIFGYANLFNGTRWDDSALVPVTDWPFVNGQTVGPVVPEGAMSAFFGEDPNGVWDLAIRDDTPNNAGMLNGWSIDVTTISAPPTVAGSTFFKAVNQTVPDAPSAGLVSTIVVTGLDPFLVDVNVITGVAHPFPSDLAIFVTSPAGTTVTLTTRNGGNRDDVFNGTVWDDAEPQTATDYPYQPDVLAPVLCPDGALGAFIGENPNGTWTLRVRDDLAGEVGFCSAWELDFITCVAPAPGSSFCTGDGLDPNVTSPCPCGNVGAPGNGCANSANANGSHLVATGGTNPDTAVLHGSGMPAVSSAIYLKGDVVDDAVFGDGVRCAGGNILRMRTVQNTAGASQFPGAGDPLLSVRGQTPVGSGLTALYQVHYRNAAAFCTPATFNVTNGWKITW